MSKTKSKSASEQKVVKIPDYIFLTNSCALPNKCMVVYFIGFNDEVTEPEFYPTEALFPLAKELSQFGYEVYLDKRNDTDQFQTYILIRDGVDSDKAIACCVEYANDLASAMLEMVEEKKNGTR